MAGALEGRREPPCAPPGRGTWGAIPPRGGASLPLATLPAPLRGGPSSTPPATENVLPAAPSPSPNPAYLVSYLLQAREAPPAPQGWGERRAARRDPKAARRTLPPALGGRGGLRPDPSRDTIQDKILGEGGRACFLFSPVQRIR